MSFSKQSLVSFATKFSGTVHSQTNGTDWTEYQYYGENGMVIKQSFASEEPAYDANVPPPNVKNGNISPLGDYLVFGDGGGWTNCSSSLGFNNTPTCSISFWINPTEAIIGGSGKQGQVNDLEFFGNPISLIKFQLNFYEFALSFDKDGSIQIIQFVNDDGSSYIDADKIKKKLLLSYSPLASAFPKFHHFVVTLDGGNLSLYINGQKTAAQHKLKQFNDITNGIDGTNVTFKFSQKHQLANVQVFKEALNAQDAKDLYTSLGGVLPQVSLDIKNEEGEQPYLFRDSYRAFNDLDFVLTAQKTFTLKKITPPDAATFDPNKHLYNFALKFTKSDFQHTEGIVLGKKDTDWRIIHKTIAEGGKEYLYLYFFYNGSVDKPLNIGDTVSFSLDQLIVTTDNTVVNILTQFIWNRNGQYVIQCFEPIQIFEEEESELIARFDFSQEVTSNSFTFPDTGEGTFEAVADGTANLVQQDGKNAISFGSIGDSSSVGIDFKNLAVKTKNQLTLTFWMKSDFSINGNLMYVNDTFYLKFTNKNNKVNLALKAGSGAEMNLGSAIDLKNIQNKWIYWAIVLDGKDVALSKIYYQIEGSSLVMGGPNSEPSSDLGLGTDGLEGKKIIIGKKWKGLFADFQIWEKPLEEGVIKKLVTLTGTPFQPLLPVDYGVPDTTKWSLQNGFGLSALFSQPNDKGNTLAVSVQPIELMVKRPYPAEVFYHFAIRFPIHDLSKSEAITVSDLPTNWKSQIVTDNRFLTIYFVFVDSFYSSQTYSTDKLNFTLNNVIGNADTIQIEYIHNTLTGKGFEVATLPVYKEYITRPLIANFDFNHTNDNQNFEDANRNGLVISSAKPVTLLPEALGNSFPLDGNNSLEVDCSKYLIDAKSSNDEDITFSFWTKLDASNIGANLSNFLEITDDYFITFNYNNNTNEVDFFVKLDVNSGNNSCLISIPSKNIINKWVFWVVVLTGQDSTLWYANEDTQYQLIRKTILIDVDNLTLTQQKITIGDGWKGGFTNFCIWSEALEKQQVQVLLDDYLYSFPIIPTTRETLLELKSSNIHPISITDLSQGMSIDVVLHKVIVIGEIKPELSIENAHVYFCFHQNSLKDNGDSLKLKIDKGDTDNTILEQKIIKHKNWVYLLVKLKAAITTKNIWAVPLSLLNIKANDGTSVVPMQVGYNNLYRSITKKGGMSGIFTPPIPIPVIQNYISTPLVASFNFDQTTHPWQFTNSTQQMIGLTDKDAVVTHLAPFHHALSLGINTNDPTSFAIDFENTQIKPLDELNFTFWLNSDYSKPIVVSLGKGFDIQFSKANQNLAFSIAGKTLTEQIADIGLNQWIFYVITISKSTGKISLSYKIKDTLTPAFTHDFPTALMPQLLGNMLTISGKMYLAKLSIWQGKALTTEQLSELTTVEHYDFPTLKPDIPKPPLSVKITGTKKDYLFSTALKNNNHLSISLENKQKIQPYGGRNIQPLPKIKFKGTSNFNPKTFNPNTDNYLFALCFRRESLQNDGQNISYLNKGQDFEKYIQIVKRIDAGGVVWVYFVNTQNDLVFPASANWIFNLANVVANAVSTVPAMFVYKNIENQSGFSLPQTLQVARFPIDTPLVANIDFSRTPDYLHFSDSIRNEIFALADSKTNTFTDAEYSDLELFKQVYAFNGKNNLSVDLSGVLLASPNSFSFSFWLKSDFKKPFVFKLDEHIALHMSEHGDKKIELTVDSNTYTSVHNLLDETGVQLKSKWILWTLVFDKNKKPELFYSIINSNTVKEIHFSKNPASLSPTLTNKKLQFIGNSGEEIAAFQTWQTALQPNQIKDLAAANNHGFVPVLPSEVTPSIGFTTSKIDNAVLSSSNPFTITIDNSKGLAVPSATLQTNAFNPLTANYQFELRFFKGTLKDDGRTATLVPSSNWNNHTSNLLRREHSDGTVSFYFVNTSGQNISDTAIKFTLNSIVGNFADEDIPFMLVYHNLSNDVDKSGFLLFDAPTTTTIEAPLVCHFKFDQLTKPQTNTKIYADDEGSPATATLSKNASVPELRGPLGDYAQFKLGDTIEIDLSRVSLNTTKQLTIDFWALTPKLGLNITADNVDNFGILFQPKAVVYNTKLYNQKTNLDFDLSDLPDKSLTQKNWIYWATVLDVENKTAAFYYKIYDEEPKNPVLNELHFWKTEQFTQTNLYDLSGQKLTITPTDYFSGNDKVLPADVFGITRFRIWQTALTKDELDKISNLDIGLFDPVLPGGLPSPIDFRLEDAKTHEQAIYITDPGESHNLELQIKNVSTLDLALPVDKGDNKVVEKVGDKADKKAERPMEETNPKAAFYLKFRAGTLADPASIKLDKTYLGTTKLTTEIELISKTIKEDNKEKTVTDFRTSQDGTVTIGFRATQALTLSNKDSKTNTSLRLFLSNVVAEAGSEGSRGTRVELKYNQLTPPKGTHFSNVLLNYLNVINHSGLKDIALAVNFLGSNTIMNDTKPNSLLLRVKNMGEKAITFKKESQLIISFDEDIQTGIVAPSGESDINVLQNKNIINYIKTRNYSNNPTKDDDWNISLDKSKHIFTLQLKEGITQKTLIGKGDLYILIQNIKTNADTLNGNANLYLHHHDLKADDGKTPYWDGLYTVPIEKTSLLVRGKDITVQGKLSAATIEATGNLTAGTIESTGNLKGNLIKSVTTITAEKDITAINGRFYDKTGEVIPVGSILPYAGSTEPKGWLLCNGRLFEKTKYPILAKFLSPFDNSYKTNDVVGYIIEESYKHNTYPHLKIISADDISIKFQYEQTHPYHKLKYKTIKIKNFRESHMWLPNLSFIVDSNNSFYYIIKY